MAWVVGVMNVNDLAARKFLWLMPLSDLLSFTFWCYSFVGNTIKWRGRTLKLTQGGKLELITNDVSKVRQYAFNLVPPFLKEARETLP